jgi:hypothetical protein
MGKEWMSFEGFNDCNNAIMAANSEVVPLGDVMGQNNSGALADAGENSEKNSSLEGLGFINNNEGIMERATADMGERENFNKSTIHNLFNNLV